MYFNITHKDKIYRIDIDYEDYLLREDYEILNTNRKTASST